MLGLGRVSLGRRTPSTSSLPKAQDTTLEAKETSSPPPPTMPASTNGHTNGNLNGQPSHSYGADSVSTSRLDVETSQLTVVHQVAISVRNDIIRELSDVDESYLTNMDISRFLEFITQQRLTNMPHKGSRFDRVLRAAEYFGIQVYAYSEMVERFIKDSKLAADVALGNCCLLLELGPGNAQALEASFGVFYKLGLSLAPLLCYRELVTAHPSIKDELSHAYARLCRLVGDVAIYYRKRINDLASGAMALDFYGVFGSKITAFHNSRGRVVDAMWRYKLDRAAHLGAMRTWLSPRDGVVLEISTDRYDSKNVRTEFTCEWAQRHLLSFFRSDDKILSVVGEAGCGKSVLSGWIEERLQRPISRQNHQTISYTFENDVPSENTSIAMVQSLLLQMLDLSIGDTALYKQLERAYERAGHLGSYSGLEDDLWDAFNTGIQTIASRKAKLVIVVDGLDGNLEGGEAFSTTRIFDRLCSLTEKRPTIRSIVFSRSSFPKHDGTQVLQIKADHVRDDIGRLIKEALAKIPHFGRRNNQEKDKVIDWLLDTAKASFLWAFLVTQLLLAEKSNEKGFQNVVDHLPTTVDAALEWVVSQLDFNKWETKHIFAWITAAERPLTLSEMRELLEVHVEKRTLVEHQSDVREALAMCGPIVQVRNGIIRLRHRWIRDFIIQKANQNKLFMPLKTAHTDLTIRLITLVRICLHNRHEEPSLDMVDFARVEKMFHSHALLEYAVRQWTYHFRQSSMTYQDGCVEVTPDFKNLFPESSFFVLVEWACWTPQTTIRDAIHMHELSLRVREAIFGKNHASVLQCLIVLGILHRSLENATESATWFYRASVCGQASLHKHSTITVTCTEWFLTITERLTFTSRTDLAIYCESMLRFIIKIKEEEHEHSDVVIRYYKRLAKLYINIKEEGNATKIYGELHRISVLRFGRSSREAKEAGEKLNIVLSKDNTQKDLTGYTRALFDTFESTDVWDVRRILITLELAERYECDGDFFQAEELFISLWRRISEFLRGTRTIELHIAKLDVAMAYFHFLSRRGRKEEASSILICVWTEYKDDVLGSETIIIRLKQIGVLLRTAGMLTIAISIFSGVFAWFKKIGKSEHEEVTTTVALISETLEEWKETKTMTTVTEETTRQMLEITITRCKITKRYRELLTICRTLIAQYMTNQKYAEVIEVTTRTLEISWGVILTTDSTAKLPAEHTADFILLVHRLAECHHKLHHYDLAERLYLRIYRACLATLRIDHEQTTVAIHVLIALYEYRRDKQIEIYREILERYRAQLGATHKLTIQTLYHLGSLCLSYGWRKQAYEYYMEILTVLSKGSKTCHHDAIEAGLLLIQYYHEEQRWVELRDTCAVLWLAYVNNEHYAWKEEIIVMLYEKYRWVLENHTKAVEWTLLYKITVQYKEVSMKRFGESAIIVITALFELAKVCEMSEEHQEEAITIYKELLTRKTTTTTVTTTEIKRRLTRVYLTITKKSTTTSTATVEASIAMLRERLESLRSDFGCWHEKTLTELHELVLLYRRLESKESHACISILQAYVVEIASTVTTSEQLYRCGIAIAAMYVECGLRSHGLEVLRQLRVQLILRDSKGCGFKLDQHVGRASYVFLVSFEMTLLGGKDCSYSELMARLLTETIMYEHFHTVKTQGKVEAIIIQGARLRAFLVVHERKQQLEVLDAQLYEVFVKHYGASISTKQSVTFMWILSLLQELGHEHQHQHGIGQAACVSSTHKVRALMQAGKYQDAYDVATCGLQFIRSQKAYYNLHNIGYGWKLSLCLGGHPKDESKMHNQMLELSRNVIREVFAACKEIKINFVQVQRKEITELVELLGNQNNYADLEWLLAELWHSRTLQKAWEPHDVVTIGTYYVHALFHNGKKTEAIACAEDILYNLRHSLHFGPLDPFTLRVAKLLSSLYTNVSRHRDAMGVHEEVIRYAIYGDDDGDDDGTRDIDELQIAQEHLELLKRTYQRLGEWDKGSRMYATLYHELAKIHGSKLGVQPIEKWSPKGADALGTYAAPASWDIAVREEQGGRPASGKGTRKSLLDRARESWFGVQDHHHRRSVLA